MCPVTAVLPTRLPVPITASEGLPTGSNRGGSSRKSAPSYGTPSVRARAASRNRSAGPEHGLVGEVEDDLRGVTGDRLLERADERDAVVLAAPQLLGAAGHHRSDDVVRQLRERIAHDRCVMLAVDHCNRSHVRDVTSDEIRPVYFSYSNVSVENWMIRSCP